MKKISIDQEMPAASRLIEAMSSLNMAEGEYLPPEDPRTDETIDVWGPAGQLEGAASLPLPYGEPKQAMLGGLAAKGLVMAGKGALGAGRVGLAAGKAGLGAGKAGLGAAGSAAKAGGKFLQNGGARGALGQAPLATNKSSLLTDVAPSVTMSSYELNRTLK